MVPPPEGKHSNTHCGARKGALLRLTLRQWHARKGGSEFDRGPDGGTGRRARLKMKTEGIAYVLDDVGNPLVILA